jgi:hypothetical protein
VTYPTLLDQKFYVNGKMTPVETIPVMGAEVIKDNCTLCGFYYYILDIL